MAKKIGNYNENLSSIYRIISQDSLILKLLSYNNDTDVFDDKELTDSEKAKIRKNHIFNLKQVDRQSVDAGVYVSLEYGIITRKDDYRKASTPQIMTDNRIGVFITCSQMLLDACNGNRALSLEWAIENALTNADIASTHGCKLGNSMPDRTVEGYYGRLIPLEFLDRNDGEYDRRGV